MIIGSLASAITLGLYIWTVIRKSQLQNAFIVAFAFFFLSACFGTSQRYGSKNVFSHYLGFHLSESSEILRYHAEILAKDPEYSFEISLSPEDAVRIGRKIGHMISTNDAAIERLPKSWHVKRIKGLESHSNPIRSTWFNFDYDASLKLGWLVITST